MARLNLCNHGDAYKHRSWTTTIDGEADNDAANRADERNKPVIFKNCATFTACISNINNAQIDNASI